MKRQKILGQKDGRGFHFFAILLPVFIFHTLGMPEAYESNRWQTLKSPNWLIF